MHTKISVVTLTYNRAEFLPLAVESVLKQTFHDWELLIIDDASTDNTEMIVEKYLTDPRIKYFKNEMNLGISKSRNKALELAQGKYIAVLDSDDLWLKAEKLQKQFDFLEKNPDFILIGGGVVVIDKSGNEIKRYLNPKIDKEVKGKMLLKNPIAHSSVMYIKNVALDFGGYDESMEYLEDYDLWLKLCKKYKLSNLNEFVTGYRVHDSNISKEKMLGMLKCNLELIKKYKNDYPNYWLAFLRRSLRLNLFKLLKRN